MSVHITLRHNFATLLWSGARDLRYIQSLLGHESNRTTERYTNITKKGFEQLISPLDYLFNDKILAEHVKIDQITSEQFDRYNVDKNNALLSTFATERQWFVNAEKTLLGIVLDSNSAFNFAQPRPKPTHHPTSGQVSKLFKKGHSILKKSISLHDMQLT